VEQGWLDVTISPINPTFAFASTSIQVSAALTDTMERGQGALEEELLVLTKFPLIDPRLHATLDSLTGT
jgi:hypothetical protein